jgi:membrane-associated protein
MDWIQLFDMAFRFDQYVDEAIAQHGTAVYLVLFAVVFCEFSFVPLFVLPGNPLIFACGAFYAAGALNGVLLLPLLSLAALLGSLLSYQIGRAFGRRATAKENQWLNPNALRQARVFYERHGALTFFLSPFIAVVRTFAPFVAGMSAMRFHRYVAFVLPGVVTWVLLLMTAGYFFGNVPLVREHMSSITLLGVLLALAGMLLSVGWNYLAARKSRRRAPPPPA